MSNSEGLAQTSPPRYLSFLIAFLWIFVSSSLYSLSVFNDYVEQIDPKSYSLRGVWSMSMSFICLAAMPTMILSGIVAGHSVSAGDPITALAVKTRRIRLLVLFASLMYASLAFAGLAVANRSGIGIWAFITIPGIGFGVCYVTAIELLVVCAPRRATVAVGAGLMAYNLGIIVFADIFRWLIEALGVVKAVYASALTTSVPIALTALVVRWPPSSVELKHDAEESELEFERAVYVQPSRFLQLPVFWVFVLTFLTLQGGSALYSYFLPIGLSFSEPIEAVLPYFQIGNFVGLAARLPTAMFIDKMAFGSGIFSIGSKNVMLLLLVMQIMLMLLMLIFSVSEHFVAFAWCSVTTWAILSGSATAAPILARDLFGKRNGAAAFGIASGISFGGGEFLAMYFISLVDKFGGIGERKPWRFVPFYEIAIAGTVITLICCLALRRSREAFPHGTVYEADEQIPLKGKRNKNHSDARLQSELV